MPARRRPSSPAASVRPAAPRTSRRLINRGFAMARDLIRWRDRHGDPGRASPCASPNRLTPIVVGSGISGGWAAKELTERGLRVLLLERGKHCRAPEGLRERPQGSVGVSISRRPLARDDRVASLSFAATIRSTKKISIGGWTNRSPPYTEVKRFDWYRGYHLGGRSLTWGRQSYRLSDLDFEANRPRKASQSTGRCATPTSRLGTIT
jgi:hypothetical protein